MTINIFLFLILFSATIVAQNNKNKAIILKSTNVQKLEKIESTYGKRQSELKTEANRIAKAKGWELTKTDDNGNFMELMKVNSKGDPIYYTTFNAGSAITTKTNTLHTGGSLGLDLNGEGIVFGQWDNGGIDQQHQEWNNNIIAPHLTFPSSHATHVAGTMVAKGVNPAAKGMAPKGSVIIYGWDNDVSEMAGEANNGLILSNHSYGLYGGNLNLQEFGRYDTAAKGYDEVQYNAPYYLVVRAAGNDRARGWNPTKNGYDVLNGAGSSKNTLVVAAVKEITNYTGPNSVEAAYFSSMGPTDDGRIKPDISAKGVGMFSTDWGGTDKYIIYNGTSMAAPSVTGSLGLLQQHYNNLHGNYMRAATLKGIAIATAEEAGIAPGPDFEFGWGVLNAKKAVESITNDGVSTVIDELYLNNGSSYSTTVNSAAGQSLIITIAWTDAAGTPVQGVDNATLMLVNDLDVRVTKGGTTYKPWILDHTNPTNPATKGDNFRDNVERINIDNTSNGEYTITVTHKGSLVGGQQYSLIIIGASGGTPQPCVATAPNGLGANNIEELSARIFWNGVTSAASYDYKYRKAGTSTWTTVNTNSSFANLTGLTGETQYQVQVRTNCSSTSSSYSSIANFTTAAVCNAWSPQGILVSDVSDNEATLDWSWNSNPLINKYNYQYRLGSGSWVSGTTANTSIQLSGLTGNSNYQFRINSECENGDISTYRTTNFSTTPSCGNLAPEHVVVSNITNSSAKLTWFVVPGAENYYRIKFKPSTRNWFSQRVVFTNNVILNSLSEGVEYDVEITARCGGGVTSQIAALNFTTAGATGNNGSNCNSVPQNFQTTNVSNNTATLTWNPVDNGYASSTLYQIRYKSAGSWYRYTTSSTNAKILTGLSGNATYTAQVKAYCSGGSSPYATLSFTTGSSSATESSINSNNNFISKYTVYPNPNKGDFKINFRKNETEIQSVTIYNMLGVKIFHKNYNSKLNTEQYSLGSTAINGLYKIVIKTKESIEYKTIFIN